ncbi:hypothetical protein CSUI_008713, partial [Cystoisospora suis]
MFLTKPTPVKIGDRIIRAKRTCPPSLRVKRQMTEMLVKEQLILAREREKREKESSLGAGVLEAHQKTYWRLSEPPRKTSLISSLSHPSPRIESKATNETGPLPPSLLLSSSSSFSSWPSSFASSVNKENGYPETAAAFSHVDSSSSKFSSPQSTAVSLPPLSPLPPSYSLQGSENNSEGMKTSMCHSEGTESHFSIEATSSLSSRMTPSSLSSSYHSFSYETMSTEPSEREEKRHAVCSSSCSSLLIGRGQSCSLSLEEDNKMKKRSLDEVPPTGVMPEGLGATVCMHSSEVTSGPLQGVEAEREEKKEHHSAKISIDGKASPPCLSSKDLSYLSTDQRGSNTQDERNKHSFSASFIERPCGDSGGSRGGEGRHHHGGSSLVNFQWREKEQGGNEGIFRWERSYQGLEEKKTEEERRRAREKELMDHRGRERDNSLLRRQAVLRQQDSCPSDSKKGESSSEKEDPFREEDEEERILHGHPKDSAAVLEDLIISSILLKETGGDGGGGGRDSFGVHTPFLSQEGREERIANRSFSSEKDLRHKEEEETKRRDTASCSHSSAPPLENPSFPSTPSPSSIFAKAENERGDFPEGADDMNPKEVSSS